VLFKKDYDAFLSSGLYHRLVEQGLFLKHREVRDSPYDPFKSYKILEPQYLDFVSYPYEWSFSQLKDAALLTIRLEREALFAGLSLKDASAYNIQFVGGKPIFIDTLSFERYRSDTPWVAYRQFCQHFLAPLVLMSYVDLRLQHLLRTYIDGIPLDVAAGLLPMRARFDLGLLLHLFMHAKAQSRYAGRRIGAGKYRLEKDRLLALLDSLESTVSRLTMKKQETAWGDYYKETNYSARAFRHKHALVRSFLTDVRPRIVWDAGGNNGEFSRDVTGRGIPCISTDSDPHAVEENYQISTRKKDRFMLPLLLDLTNPSPPLGWQGDERLSFMQRGPFSACLALALIHHLAIGNNLPLERIAQFFAATSRHLLIEFVPKDDSQVKKLLSTREDIFPHYTQSHFETSFGRHFHIKKKMPIRTSKRVMYGMERKH
jgi:hypothetical protein